MLPLQVLVVALTTVLSGVSAVGTVPNQFLVRYELLGDAKGSKAFYHMPRTVQDARKDSFAQAATRPTDNTTVWCRAKDHRVCVLFDTKGSAAGVVWSVAAKDVQTSNTPIKIADQPEWTRQTLLGVDVYSLTAFFVSKDVLQKGGRTLTADTHTAPDGLYFLQSNKNGVETGRLHLSTDEKDAEPAGFNKQACFHGMGQHYFQGLTKTSKCETLKPYFTLYGPKTSKLVGFGFTMYGKTVLGSRNWYENPNRLAAKIIAPDSPQCLGDYNKKYGFFTSHVFFLEKHWELKCGWLL